MADLELAAEFWKQLIHTLGPEDSWYYGFSPKRKGATLKRSAIEHTTGVNGVKLCFRWRANEIHATVTIEDLGIERINNYMNQMKKYEFEIRTALSRNTDDQWPEVEDGGSSAARIITRIPHQGTCTKEWWSDCIIDLRDVMDEYRKIIEPYFKELKDLKESYYYVIKLHNTFKDDPSFKAGFSVNPRNRFKQHVAKFSNHSRSTNWKLESVETVQFATGEEVRKFEKKLLNKKPIRSPNIKSLSFELFSINPLEYAREKGWL